MALDTIVVGIPRETEHMSPLIEGQIDERRALARALSEEGFRVFQTPVKWPRNLYTYFNGKLVTVKERGPYGNNGLVLPCSDFIMASTALLKEAHVSMEEAAEKLWQLYSTQEQPIRKVVFLQPGSYSPHIDLVVLACQEKKFLLFEKEYRREMDFETQIALDELAGNSGFKVEVIPSSDYDSDFRTRQWPCNSLLLKGKSGLLAFHDDTAQDSCLDGLWDIYGISGVALEFSENSKDKGGIFCATNVLPPGYKRDLIESIEFSD